jgi:hypothetical protein
MPSKQAFREFPAWLPESTKNAKKTEPPRRSSRLYEVPQNKANPVESWKALKI